jgi:N utilization substance protein B
LSRRTARKQAFLNLYQSDVNDSPLGPTMKRWREYRGDLEAYAVRLARGVEEEQEHLDAVLSEVSVGWPVRFCASPSTRCSTSMTSPPTSL